MPAAPASPLPPGSAIGIMGGGQLGRMTALAAAALGYDVRVFSPEADSPAGRVAAAETVADYADEASLDAFAAAVDVVTFEFENVPHASVRRLADRVPVRPGWEALRIAQDRREEKRFLQLIGVPTAPFAEAAARADLDAAVEQVGRPAVLKTARLGYDGKGQAAIEPAGSLDAAWDATGGAPAVVEARIDFACEISVIVARALDGTTAAYDAVENRHVRHILDTTIAPARVSPAVASRARDIAVRIAEGLDLAGLVAVEMFVTRDDALLVNEIAPRPHNSGHWTIDACAVSQFSQFVRAICGLPLGSPERHSDAVTKNLLGDEASEWARVLAEPGACLHLYGKRAARPGRKMGHVTRLRPRRD